MAPLTAAPGEDRSALSTHFVSAVLLAGVLCVPTPGAGSADAASRTGEGSLGGPGPRSAHALAHHERLRRTLLVGGTTEDVDGGIHAWDGESWQRVGDLTDGPGSRGHFALAFDPVSDRLLLHGGLGLRPGRAGGEQHGDLWSWDGETWTRVHGPDEGPGVRDHHAMVWDRRRSELVLYGGGLGLPGDQELLGDTWILDASGWRPVEGPSPPARSTHRLAWDDDRDRVVLFGGWGDNGLLGDTWEWDGERWHSVAAEGPSPRFATRLAFDDVLRRIVLSGGRDASGNLADTWEWDGSAWTPFGKAGPGRRNVHALAGDPDRGRLVLYGGLTEDGRPADTWERDGRRWLRRDVPAEGPAGRGTAVGAWDPHRGRLLVFGGIGAEPRAFADLWSWNRSGWTEVEGSSSGAEGDARPTGRFNASGAFLASRDQFVVHGGGGIDERRGDTWILEGGVWRLHEGDGPAARTCARMVARPDRADLILYGGAGEGGVPLAETWRWDGDSWALLETETGPPGVCFHAMAYDAARSRIVHFGGRGASSQGRETWTYQDPADDTGSGWVLIDLAGPPPRDHHAMAWNAERREVVLFGGGAQDPNGSWDGAALGDTWVWDGTGWERRPDPGGPARFHVPLLTGGPDGVVLFGGSNPDGSHADVWQWDGTRWHLIERSASR